ncbi:hypothetical protein [Pedobacter agri]|uniref:Uncharacterized protein n=1 Tax=Pedobacter agri TaxID=454586 RepID=A0A9X3DC47_9SPHI|nr:hypothetical protein [Pedobacter agri]MCX3264983.1 hypothetical protein [Pedobacter agri]
MMSWISFLTWILGIYFFYYSANIGFDLLKVRRSVDVGDNTLISVKVDTEDETMFPVKVSDGEEIDYFIDEGDTFVPESPIYSSAGVNIRQLFELARSESIEFTGKVKY